MFGDFLLSICICLTVFYGCAESCFPRSLRATVAQSMAVGYVISKVDLGHCGSQPLHWTTTDPDFAVERDGSIVTVHVATVPANGRAFSVWAHSPRGPRRKMDVSLSQKSTKVLQSGTLRRSKRRWSPLPFNIIENDRPPFPKDVERIASDSSTMYSVYYVLSGPGVTEEPVGMFSLDQLSGMVKVHRAVDREQYPQFQFQARVYDKITNQETDLPLPVTVNVDDVNDNKPTFTDALQFSVLEQSSAGTMVGKVNATDRDEPGTDHTKIRYSLLTGTDLFSINPQTGVISTRTATLDREVKDKHFVTVEIKDMNGALSGLSNTATATILLMDINDNPPTFTKTSLSTNIPENQGDGLLLRIPVADKDLEKTPNWNALFVITKGNENGNFRIDTDPETNEGLLYLIKPLDYEKSKELKVEVQAQNQAKLSGTANTWLSTVVDVKVGDVDEGPEFSAPNLYLQVKENTPNGTLIGTYTAVDPETKSSAGIKYYEITDPASWIHVGESTGQLKIANTVDRESSFVKNGLYNITVKAVDASSRTGTGTVVIRVEDENDNTPLVPSGLVLCESEGKLGSVLLTAADHDQPPFSAPFTFELGEPQDRKWILKDVNETAAMLEHTKELPRGVYSVPVLVKDLQGAGQTQTATVTICQCRNGVCLAHQNSAALGAWGVLAMLLALALLLLLFILAAIVCVTKGDKLDLEDSGESGGMLLKSNTEGPGEQGSNIVIVPGLSSGLEQSVKGSVMDVGREGIVGTKNVSTVAGAWHGAQQPLMQQTTDIMTTDIRDVYASGQYGQYRLGGTGGVTMDNGFLLKYQDASALHTWNTNNLFLNQKLGYLASEGEDRYAEDILHSYGFEGEGSRAGSVGCCSDQDDQDDLEFLNTLGPKFRTLAEVCRK